MVQSLLLSSCAVLTLYTAAAFALHLTQVPGYPGKRTSRPHKLDEGSVLAIEMEDSNDGHISDYVELHDSPANKRSGGNLPDSGRILQTNVGEGLRLMDLIPKQLWKNAPQKKNVHTAQAPKLSDFITNLGVRVSAPQWRSFRARASDSPSPAQIRDAIMYIVDNNGRLSVELPINEQDKVSFKHFMNNKAVLEQNLE